MTPKDLAAALAALSGTTGADRPFAPDPGAEAEIADWEATLAALALTAEPADPPPDLLARIEARIDGDAPPGTRIVRGDSGGWRRLAPGVWLKLLRGRLSGGDATFLLRCEPGAEIPEHDHEGEEEALVLEGRVTLSGVTFHAGDYFCADAGSHHQTARTDAGCLLFISRHRAA